MWQIKKSPIFEIYTCISHNIIYFITQSENLINYWQKENIKNVRVWIYKYVSYNIIMAINNNNWKKALNKYMNITQVMVLKIIYI